MHSPKHQPENEQRMSGGVPRSMLLRRKKRIFEGTPVKRPNLGENIFSISPIQCCESPSCCFRTACERSVAKRSSTKDELKTCCTSVSPTCSTSTSDDQAARMNSVSRLKTNRAPVSNVGSPAPCAFAGDEDWTVSSVSPYHNNAFKLRNKENICSTPLRDSKECQSQQNVSVLETSPIATCMEARRIKQSPETVDPDFLNSTPCPGKNGSKFVQASATDEVPDELQNSVVFDTGIRDNEEDERGLQKLSFDHWLQKEAAEKTIINRTIAKMHNHSINKTNDLCCSVHFEEKLSHHSIMAFDKEEELNDGEVETDSQFIVQEPHVISLLHESLRLGSRNNTVLEIVEKDDNVVVVEHADSTLTNEDLTISKYAKPSEGDEEEKSALPAVGLVPSHSSKSESDKSSTKVEIGFQILCDPDVQQDQKIDVANKSCEIIDEIFLKPLSTAATSERKPLRAITFAAEDNVVSSVPIKGKVREPFKSLDPNENYDIEHPDWEEVRKLSTDEERYEQVRRCWSSKVVPDPNRDLTRYSFRKKNIPKPNPAFDVHHERHKRQASENVHVRSAKRMRTQSVPCTETIDIKIESMMRKLNEREEDIRSQFRDEMRYLLREQNRAEMRFHSSRHRNHNRGYNFQPFYDSYMNAMHTASDAVMQRQHENEQNNLKFRYGHELRCVENCYNTEIDMLVEVKHEINKFCRFYSGLKKESDPTVLTPAQLDELNEIENVYQQFEKNYYDPNA